MDYRELGSSGIQVSEVCLGTWTIGAESWVGVNDEESIETIRTAIDLGMNFIDTAHAYGLGHAERIIGEALKGRREQAVICTKVATRWDEEGTRYPDCSYDFIMQAVEDGLERLQTDYVDVYLVHYYYTKVPIKETMRAMARLLDEKVVRAVGVSRYDVPQLEEARKYVELNVGQYDLSIFQRHFSYQTPPDPDRPVRPIAPVLDYCRVNNIGVMGYGAVAKGLLAGRFDGTETFPEGDPRSRNKMFQGEEFKKRVKAAEKMRPIAEKHGKTLAQLAINWNLCQPGVTTALVGARSPAQVRDNAGGSGWRLKQEDLEEIERIVAHIE